MTRAEPTGTTEAGIAVGMLVEPVTDAADALLQAARRMTEPSGLSPAWWRVLSAVRDGARPVPAIAERVRMGMSRQAVQRIADGLVEQGFARWVDNPGHKRSKLMEPTERGFVALEEIIERQVAWANAVGAELDADALQQVASVLVRLREASAGYRATSDD